VELLHSSFIRSDSSTLNTDAILFNGLSGIDGDLIFSLVTIFQPLEKNISMTKLDGMPQWSSYQIIVLKINVQITD
jgi:hypothetical protein